MVFVTQSRLSTKRTTLSKVTSQTNVLSNNELGCLVQNLRPEWQKGELNSFTHLPGGYSNRNYRFAYQQEEFVLRVPGAAEANFKVEDNWLSKWATRFAPEVIAFDTEQGALITRFISLPLLAERCISADELAEFLKYFHNSFELDIPYPRSYLNERIATWLEDANPNTELMKLFHALPKADKELRVCHNDLNPWNILIDTQSPESWRVLDWEMAGLNNPLFDLVCLHEGVANRISLEDLIELYFCGVKDDKNANRKPEAVEVRETVCLFWFREYAWAINQIHLGNNIEAIRTQAEEFERRLLTTIV